MTALLLVAGATAGSAEAQERYPRMGEPSFRSLGIEAASPAVALPYGRYHSPPGERVMSDDVSRSRDGAMLPLGAADVNRRSSSQHFEMTGVEGAVCCLPLRLS
jgi:hypothetical protein